MSAYYSIYTECKVSTEDDTSKWILLDPFIKELKSGEMKISPTYESFSRSYFGDTYEKFEDYSQGQPPKESLSKELQTKFSFMYDKPEDSIWYSSRVFAVNFNDIKNLVSNTEFMHCGFISKDAIQAYKLGDIEELYPVEYDNDDPFWKYTPEERSQIYEYFEWDNNYEWLFYWKIIKQRVNDRIEDFKTVNWDTDIAEIRLIIYMD